MDNSFMASCLADGVDFQMLCVTANDINEVLDIGYERTCALL